MSEHSSISEMWLNQSKTHDNQRNIIILFELCAVCTVVIFFIVSHNQEKKMALPSLIHLLSHFRWSPFISSTVIPKLLFWSLFAHIQTICRICLIDFAEVIAYSSHRPKNLFPPNLWRENNGCTNSICHGTRLYCFISSREASVQFGWIVLEKRGTKERKPEEEGLSVLSYRHG